MPPEEISLRNVVLGTRACCRGWDGRGGSGAIEDGDGAVKLRISFCGIIVLRDFYLHIGSQSRFMNGAFFRRDPLGDRDL